MTMAAVGRAARGSSVEHAELVAPGVAHDPEVKAAVLLMVIAASGQTRTGTGLRTVTLPTVAAEALAEVAVSWWNGRWACQDLNLGPHPYQGSRAKRCADRRFPRSCVSVGDEGMRSNAST